MKASKCASSKNNCRFEIQTILVNIPTWAYGFKIKRIPSSLSIFTLKNNLPIPYNLPSLSSAHETVAIMNHCCYCFDGLWKVKVKYIILCLNAFAKLRSAKETSRQTVLMGN